MSSDAKSWNRLVRRRCFDQHNSHLLGSSLHFDHIDDPPSVPCLTVEYREETRLIASETAPAPDPSRLLTGEECLQ
eukprot:3250771-Alexandrium_andersonii.AAC.1